MGEEAPSPVICTGEGPTQFFAPGVFLKIC
jgi:hypothetical protein